MVSLDIYRDAVILLSSLNLSVEFDLINNCMHVSEIYEPEDFLENLRRQTSSGSNNRQIEEVSI